MADTMLATARALRTVGFVAMLCATATGVAQPPAKTPEPKAGRSLDSLKIPPGTIIVVSDNPRDAFQNVDAVVVSPDEYRKLVEAAEQAKRPAVPDKPEVPSVCRIGGKIETRGTQDIAVLRVTYQFRTTAARTIVLLGLQKGKPTAARLGDGKLPVLIAGKDDDGLSAQIDGAGEHSLTVDVEVSLSSRSTKNGERGFELGLPGSAITAIENLQLPDRAARARIGGRAVPVRLLAQANAAYVLGPAARLDVSWDVQASGNAPEPLTAVDGIVDVRIDEKTATTHTRLIVKVPRGIAGAFQIRTPPNTELTAEAGDPTLKVERPKDAKSPIWMVHRDPSADELRLDATTKSDMKTGEPIRIVLPSVIDASPQRGTLTVGGPPNVRLNYRVGSGADISRRDGSDDTGRDAAFQYSRVPEGPVLEIDASPIRGEVETTIAHLFTLTEVGTRWQGKIDLRPIRTEVGYLDVEVPTELQELRAASSEFVDTIQPLREVGPSRKLVRVQLAESRRRPFTVVLEGVYPLAVGASSASLPVPRVAGTLDKGGSVAASVPNGLELRAGLHDVDTNRVGDWERPLDAGPRGPMSAMATVERTPARIDLSWRSPRGDAAASAQVHIFLDERQAALRCVWSLPPSFDGVRKFQLRGPPILAGRLRAVESCTLTAIAPGEWTVQPTAAVFSVAGSFNLPANVATPVVVPLVWLDPCPRCETELRVWAGPTVSPLRAFGPWTELPPQPVPEQPDFPSLCLHGSGTQLPLSLAIQRSEGAGPAVVERLWGQVMLDGNGHQTYRVRAWVRANRGRTIALELPSGIEASYVEVLVEGKRLSATGDEASRRWLLPAAADSVRRSRLVEFRYARRPVDGFVWSPCVELPRFLGCEPPPTRLQVGFTSDAVPLAWADGYDHAESLHWNRGIPTLRPAHETAHHAAWFAGDNRSFQDQNAVIAEVLDSGLAASGVEGTLRLIVLPRSTLMLATSALALLSCAGLAVARPAWVRSLLVGGAVVALTTAAAVVPQPTGRLLLAAIPGLLAVPLALAMRSLVRRRYRRRLQFLPGFARGTPASSSVTRGSGSATLAREPSTIDSPAQVPDLSSSRQVWP